MAPRLPLEPLPVFSHEFQIDGLEFFSNPILQAARFENEDVTRFMS